MMKRFQMESQIGNRKRYTASSLHMKHRKHEHIPRRHNYLINNDTQAPEVGLIDRIGLKVQDLGSGENGT